MNKLITRIVGAALGLTMAVGVGVGLAVGSSKEAVPVRATDGYRTLYTLDTTNTSNKTSNGTYGSTGTATVDGVSWTFTGNGTVNPWRLGGKTAASGNQPFWTTTAFSSAIDRIEVTFGSLSGLTFSSFSASIHNSAQDASTGNNAVATFSDLTHTANTTVGIDLGAEYSGKFYRFVPNLTISATSNKYLQMSKVEFLITESSDPFMEISDTELTIAKDSTNTFTVEVANLTGQLTVSSSDTSKVTVDSISPTPANPTADGTYTVTLGGAAKTTSPVTITAACTADSLSKTLESSVEEIVEYPLITDGITNGSYVIYYSGKAMNTTVTSNRLQYEAVTPASNKIQDPASNIVWKVRKSNANYYTLYNEDESKYAAATGSNNQAQMLADGTDDKALWTITGSSTFEIVNKARTAASGNANLRNNGSYGFGCYATGTGGALSLYGFHEDVLTVTENAKTIDKGSNATVTLGVTNPTGTATYSATSGDTSVATVEVSGTTLTINGVGVGSTTITASLLIDGAAVDFAEIAVTVNSSVELDEIVIKAGGNEVAGQTVHLSQGDELTLSYYALDTEASEWEGDVTYTISSTAYATLSGSTITASTSTYGGSTTVTVTADDYPTKSSSFTLVVDQWSGVLTVGSSYVLATVTTYTDHPSTLTGLETSTGKVGTTTENVAFLSTDIELVVEAGNTYNSYSFKIDDTYYLSGNGSKTDLYKSIEKNDNSSWTVSVNNGAYIITNVGTPARFLSYNYANGNPRFACYTATQTADVRLVEVTSLIALQGRTEEFCQTYMHPEIAIDNEEDTGACRGNDGYFLTAKAALEKSQASGGYSDCVEQFASSGNMWNRYVAWGEAAGYSVSFTNNAISYSRATLNSLINAGENNATAIIVIVSMVSLTAIGGYFFLKKRKEQ